jgi:hypothetical protein
VDGLEGSFILTRDLRNGGCLLLRSCPHRRWLAQLGAGAPRVIEMANGDSSMPRSGQIFFEEGGSGHLASLNFTAPSAAARLSFGFDYSSDLDDADILMQRTRLDAALRQDLTDNSGWAVDGSMASVEYDNPITTIDAVRVDVGLAYLHGLSNDWNLAARVEHQVLYEDGEHRLGSVRINFT